MGLFFSDLNWGSSKYVYLNKQLTKAGDIYCYVLLLDSTENVFFSRNGTIEQCTK